MSLNKFMHPRNRYRNAKPNFLQLALKYPDFRAHTTQDDSGKVFLDFKNADALRALTTCLLKEDFDLTVHLPADRLVPTLPLRLNYIHWLEDIVGISEGKWGIDVGTGASCVYPLLAAKMNKWHFLATEADPENVFHANKNVTANGLQDLIQVKQVSTEDALIGPLESFTATTKFDFCMCNPPFFADHMEAQAITNTRSVDRPEAGSVSTASPQESISQGGEVGFIRQMMEESAVLRDKIRVYTSMVGKKSSLTQLKEELRHQKVAKFSTTEFCQGKTMRWGIAWTYDSSVSFPRSQFESRKEKPPLQYMVPRGAGGVEYTVHTVAAYLRGLLESIKVHCFQGKQAKSYTSITLTAVENTWCHQRRLRRQKQRQGGEQQKKQQEDGTQSSEQEGQVSENGMPTPQGDVKKSVVTVSSDISENTGSGDRSVQNISGGKRPPDDSVDGADDSVKRLKRENLGGESTVYCDPNGREMGPDSSASQRTSHSEKCSESEKGLGNIAGSNQVVSTEDNHADDKEEESSSGPSLTSPKEFILKCVMRLKRVDEQVQLELEWLDGQSRELMYQVMTFLKNKMAQGKK